MSEKTKTLLMLAAAAALAIAAAITLHWRIHVDDVIVTDEVIEANIERLQHMGEEPETTPPPEPIHIPSTDAILLAKIMMKEEGHDWPDAMIMCLGEVVVYRVASSEFPDTIREVLYEVDYDANGREYIQYAPVHEPGWENFVPDQHHIELAERILDGERVLNNPQIVYQATFEQGRGTVMTYHDFYLGTTTYFCLTDKPGLYA